MSASESVDPDVLAANVRAAAHYEAIDGVLLLLAEARERAENAAGSITADKGQPHLVAALRRLDAELLAQHRRLLEDAFLGSSRPRSQQLELDAA